MRLTEASVAIRPRSAWEAIDLGVLLARRHAGLSGDVGDIDAGEPVRTKLGQRCGDESTGRRPRDG